MNNDINQEVYLAKSTAFQTLPVFIKNAEGLSVQIITSNGSSFAATAYIQLSNTGENWVTLAASGQEIALAGASDIGLFDIPMTAAAFYRVSIVFTTGSANFSFIQNVKDI